MMNLNNKRNNMDTMHKLLVESGWTYFGGNEYALDDTKAKVKNLHLMLYPSGYKLWSTSEKVFEIKFKLEVERDIFLIKKRYLKD